MPAPQAATRIASSQLVFVKPEKAKGRRLLVRICDSGGGGGRNGRGVTVEAVNGAVKLNGAAVVADVWQVPAPPPIDDDVDDAFPLGKFVEGRLVYRQQFVIRSYEIGPDRTATMETLMNLLQETALNHVMCSGLAGDGFGATRQMSLRKLIWVVTRINIQVDKYSRWGDVVEIDTWVASSGKNGMRRDWIIRDRNTKNMIARATSNWVMMNRETRRLSKIPEEVRQEVLPFYLDRSIIAANANGGGRKIEKLTDSTAGHVRSGLAVRTTPPLSTCLFSYSNPRWSDMDVNQHVNNVKYIGWILESVPLDVLEDYHLTSITLDYRRECRQSQLLESLTSMTSSATAEPPLPASSRCGSDLHSTHLIRQQDDRAEIVRARAEWRRKEHRGETKQP
ncbi:Palmitoyl-acyl carrier protein thioesterase, chloroplastic [Dichanthelium oligosanthes]|uniref:Acyl-[acyl-carrier-protein] hydrolase n=1 Tax=Dichanthelium oligosanthes TaxID=888268 RepID=A0A1E5VTV3_9POAL|nr:Palmitoyl-acyl carrier protein thioesterase, chloroplastic [Dichanthelium oligosanthes]